MAGQYRCVHCGQACGEIGHLRVSTDARPICPNTKPVEIVTTGNGRAPRAIGFCCPMGHTCQFGLPETIHRRSKTAWRKDLPTMKQVEYLKALGYTGPDPKTKGEASDLLGEYLTREAGIVPGADRGIIVRKRGPKEGPVS